MGYFKFKNPYWTNTMKVSFLQRRIIVASIMYYELNESAISDRVYDMISKQLVEMQKELTEEEFKRTDYYYCMYDFDGSTGFDLRDRLTDYDRKYLTNIAEQVLKSNAVKS